MLEREVNVVFMGGRINRTTLFYRVILPGFVLANLGLGLYNLSFLGPKTIFEWRIGDEDKEDKDDKEGKDDKETSDDAHHTLNRAFDFEIRASAGDEMPGMSETWRFQSRKPATLLSRPPAV